MIVVARETEGQKRLFEQFQELNKSSPSVHHRVPIKSPPEEVVASLPHHVREQILGKHLSYLSMEVNWSSLIKTVPIILDQDYYEIGFVVSPFELTDIQVASIVEFLTEGSTSELQPMLEFVTQRGCIFTFLPERWHLAVLAAKEYLLPDSL